MIKLKDLLKESSPGYENRQFGDPLPTVKDITREYQKKNGIKEENLNEAPNRDIVRQWQMTEMDFMMGIRKIKEMMDKSTGSKTSSRLLDKAFGKVSPMMDKLGKLIDNLAEKG